MANRLATVIESTYYEGHKEQARAFAEASRRGWEWAAEHPEETLDIVMVYILQNGVASNTPAQRWMLEECLRLLVDSKTGKRTYRLDPQALDVANRILCEGGFLKTPITYQQITRP